MQNRTRVYDLSFVSPQRKPRTKPQIVFTIHSDHLPEYIDRLITVCRNHRKTVIEYFSEGEDFVLPIPDLFGHREFGFGKCGVVHQSGNDLQLCLDLSEKSLSHVAHTIHLLTMVMNIPLEKSSFRSNLSQQMELETLCMKNRPSYGHAIYGRVIGNFSAWIQKQCKDASKNARVPVPGEIVKAMQEAWYAVAPPKLKKYAKECRGYFSPEGRFVLDCFGNACDVAIYPDRFHLNSEYGSEFSCHNLDWASQQITLIAGLARMCQLVREDE